LEYDFGFRYSFELMNILFLTILDFSSINENGIYTDLMRQFVKKGHQVYIVSPVEKRKHQQERMINDENCKILKIKIGNIQKTNLIEKGISTLLIEAKFIKGINKYFSDVKFDLVLISTPPITFQKIVAYINKRDNAKTYLMLKDIFPQNAIDLGMLRKDGIIGLLYRYFRTKEKSLYNQVNYIGCMSRANVDYILLNNPEISADKVEVCPNSIEPKKIETNKIKIKNKYNIPLNKIILIYGGNLGKPQGIEFLIECLHVNKENEQVYFVIVGSGTEFKRIKTIIDSDKINNAQLLAEMNNNDYEILVNSCDVGLIFLDRRFTIPNFPSRLLSYMQASMPVLAATDVNTDLGRIIENSNFGFWCESGDIYEFNRDIKKLCNIKLRKQMGERAREYLENNFKSIYSYEIIMKHFELRNLFVNNEKKIM
jgi:hypothetical protein